MQLTLQIINTEHPVLPSNTVDCVLADVKRPTKNQNDCFAFVVCVWVCVNELSCRQMNRNRQISRLYDMLLLAKWKTIAAINQHLPLFFFFLFILFAFAKEKMKSTVVDCCPWPMIPSLYLIAYIIIDPTTTIPFKNVFNYSNRRHRSFHFITIIITIIITILYSMRFGHW